MPDERSERERSAKQRQFGSPREGKLKNPGTDHRVLGFFF